jgi:hypothetical protein
MKHRRAALVDDWTTSIHEAGHGSSAVALGLRFTSIDIISSKGQRGGIVWPNDLWKLMQEEDRSAHVVDLFQRRITTMFCGIAAQRRVAAGTTDLWYMVVRIASRPMCGCND